MDIKVNEGVVLVFDLDDTLYNEIQYIRSAFREIAQKLDHDAWKNLFVTMFSMHRNKLDVFQYLAENYAVEKKQLKIWYDIHIPDINPFVQVSDLFRAIKSKAGSIAIITDGYSKRQRTKLSALNLYNQIDYIVVSEELGTEKPHMGNYKSIENHFEAKTYYYIADNFRKDFISPIKLGWKTIGLIDNGLNIHTDHYLQPKDNWPQELIFALDEIQIV